jgi:Protein of unknown function (DUF3617)
MNKSLLSGCVLSIICLTTALSCNAAPPENMKPGNYEYITKTEMFGLTIPVSFKQCVTQKDIDSNSAYVNQQGQKGCTPPVVTRKGKEIAVKYTCTEPKMTAEGTGSITDTGINFEMKVIQHEMNDAVLKTKLSATRLGDCK